MFIVVYNIFSVYLSMTGIITGVGRVASELPNFRSPEDQLISDVSQS